MAHSRVSRPCWPTRASSWNQISSGLPAACSGSAAVTNSGKFFKGLLGRRIAVGVLGTCGKTAEVELAQQLADRALVQRHAEALGDALAQVRASPAHHPIPLRVRPLLDPGGEFGLLRRREAGLAPRRGSVGQPRKPLGVVAVDPIAQGLALHAAAPGGLLARVSLEDEGDGQHASCGSGISGSCGLAA